MSIRFDGQVAIVTGAGNGLGRSHALGLAERGAKVVVNDFGGARDGTGGSSAAAEAVVAEIEAAGGEAMANGADVSNFDECAAMAQAALARWGRIDILINNAGILRDRSFGKMTAGDWKAVIDVHLNGSAHCSLAVWNAMKEQGYGRILMTTSTSGLYGNFGQTNYGAAKMGVVGLMNSLVIEGARNGIFVNCVAPTAATRMTEDILTPEMLAMLKPEFVTPAALFLVSRDAPNRTVMLAGAGYFAKVEIRESEGLYLPQEMRTPDAIAARYGEISDMSAASVYGEGREHVMKIVTAATQANKA